MLASVLVKPTYSTAKPTQELRAGLNLDRRCLVQALPEQVPLAFNGVKIRRVLGEVLNDRATSFAQGSKVAILPQAARMALHQVHGVREEEYNKDTAGNAPKVESELRSGASLSLYIYIHTYT